MKIIRARNPEAVSYIVPHLLNTGDYENPEAFAESLRYELTYNPEALCLLLMFDGDELTGFVLVHANTDASYVFLHQVWFKEGKANNTMFVQVCMWAMALGKTEIRTETFRSPEAIQKKWGFEPISTVMGYKIPEDFDLRVFDVSTPNTSEKGVSDGNGDEVQSESTTGSDEQCVAGSDVPTTPPTDE